MRTAKDTSDESTCPPGETCERARGWISNLYETIDDCCASDAAQLKVDAEQCRANSGAVAINVVNEAVPTTTAAEGEWFRHAEANRCAKLCRVSSLDPSCGSPPRPSLPRYGTLEECCTSELDFLNLDTCVELSEKGGRLGDLVGTEEYYVDWIHQRCMRNCPVGKGPGCGGIAGGKWVDLYDNANDCCANLHYISISDCFSL